MGTTTFGREGEALLRWCAEVYCAEHRIEGRPLRFDVVEVLALPGAPPRLRHIPNAF